MMINKPLNFKQLKGKCGSKIDIKNYIPELYKEKIELMKMVCNNSKGVGLASVQIGLSDHLFIAKREKFSEFETFFNTEIIDKSEEYVVTTEGCLSIPGIYLPIKRHKLISIKYFNGIDEIIEDLDEDFSVVVQHELSHLEGKTLFDLTTLNREQKREILKKV